MSVSAEAHTIDLAKVPAELIGYNQWVAWRWETRDGKGTKVPYTIVNEAAFFTANDSFLRRASSTDPATWLSFNHACAALINPTLAGIGFVFTAGDPFCGVDLDHCYDPASGEIQPWAQKWIEKLDSYSEVTPSRTGVHVWLHAKVPGSWKRRQGVEIYDQGRFFTVTGWHLPNTSLTIEAR